MGTNTCRKKRVSAKKTKTNSKNSPQKSKMDISEPDQKKKIWSFDALVEAMEPSREEMEYREEKAKESDFVQKYSKLFNCTKCQGSIKPIVVKHEKVPVHPCLGVLMCQKCCDYYEDGEFSLDSDGEDKYCRWCGEGGTIFSCSNCICGFCAACIKRHFKNEYFKEVQEDEQWLCFFCNPQPLWDHRFICALAVKMSESSLLGFKEENIINSDEGNIQKTDTSIEEDPTTKLKNSKKRTLSKKKSPSQYSTEFKNSTSRENRISIYTSSSDDSDSEAPLKRVKSTNSPPIGKLINRARTDSFENTKSNVFNELQKILTTSENQMEFGVTWSNKMLKKIATPDNITTKAQLVKECQKIKYFLSLLSASLVQCSNSVHSIEKNLHKNNGQKLHLSSPKKDHSAYTTILQFLGFIKGQVKTFMDKGISLPEIFEAEIYDDDKVIGIKKKTYSSSSKSSHSRSKASGSCNSSYGTENTEVQQYNKVDELDKIRDDDILELVGDQSMEKEDFNTEDEDEFLGHDSSDTTLGELNDFKSTVDPKDDIREILAVLENA